MQVAVGSGPKAHRSYLYTYYVAIKVPNDYCISKKDSNRLSYSFYKISIIFV